MSNKSSQQIKQKHIPIRTCIATRVKKPKNELVRIVIDPETGKAVIDLRSKIRARGASVDTSEKAFDLMVKKRALQRALKLDNDLSKEEYENLKKDFLNAIEEKSFRPTNKAVKVRISKEEMKEKLS